MNELSHWFKGYGSKPKNTALYVCAKLDETAHTQLVDWATENIGPQLDGKLFAHHMTLHFGCKKPEFVEQFDIGSKLPLKVVGFADDGNAQAVVVAVDMSRFNGTTFEAAVEGGKIPHVTISCNNETKPKHSNDLLQAGFTPVDGITFETTIGFMDRKGGFHSKIHWSSEDSQEVA